jgi:hypothetical protein
LKTSNFSKNLKQEILLKIIKMKLRTLKEPSMRKRKKPLKSHFKKQKKIPNPRDSFMNIKGMR